MSEEISIVQARRIALHAQGFGGARPKGRIDRRHLRKTMRRLHLLQLDSVPVVIRTQYMPLFSRLGPYRSELLDEIAYDDGEWFEAWSHEASLLPVESEPWLRWSKDQARQGRTWKHLHALAKKDPGYVGAVLDEVKARGALTAGELSDPRPRSGRGWGSRSAGAVALDWLYRVGELGVRRNRRFVKRFDLLERIVPGRILRCSTPGFEAALDELILRSARAHGIASADCLVDYFRLPPRPTRARIEALVEDRRLVRCWVEGWRQPAYRHPEAMRPRSIHAAALLSPFDPVVWNRKRIRALFGFDYRLEIYTPEAKRRHGYYVLPFLLGDRLVGRFDLKTDQEAGRLRVLSAHVEEGAAPGTVAAAAARELVQLARFVGPARVVVGRRGNLVAALRKEVAALAD